MGGILGDESFFDGNGIDMFFLCWTVVSDLGTLLLSLENLIFHDQQPLVIMVVRMRLTVEA